MSETYAQAANRLLCRMDERQKLVQFPVTPQGRSRLRQELARGVEIEGRNFDAEIDVLKMLGEDSHNHA